MASGQRSVPYKQAGHMAAPTSIALASKKGAYNYLLILVDEMM